ncbi:competence protein CoiA [Xenorhabdus eapokensis]|uniref:Putative competence protein n=1 Tax=Xenorhabdus eapokensis TaxID=1873482 RepID=A0A1Q5TQT8_9GAMM|nr:competence protein CoiA family protein [Xenorhabdus eapokensis]OKP02592.1 putative competence protein [Xenorhabdus eapokensis]
MLTALQNDKIIIARDAQKPGEFICPECRQLVILKKGKKVIHHFAHKSPVTCAYGEGETLAHQEAKLELFDVLMADDTVTEVELEKSFGTVRADVYARIDGRRVVFEVQRSSIDIDTLAKRTTEYSQRGISICWLLLPRDDVYGSRITPKNWEKWIHASNLGEVYFWLGDGYVLPVKFSTFYLDVPLTDFGGGYSKRSKLYRTPVRSPKLHIVRDFAHEGASPWGAGAYILPYRRLWKRI